METWKTWKTWKTWIRNGFAMSLEDPSDVTSQEDLSALPVETKMCRLRLQLTETDVSNRIQFTSLVSEYRYLVCALVPVKQ